MCKAYSAAYVRSNLPHEYSDTQWDRWCSYCISFVTIWLNYLANAHRIRLAIFLLTGDQMRRNYYYIQKRRNPDGQTRTTRPEGAGAQAHRHAQSTPRSCRRSPVQTEPLLRSQGSSPSSLRDATEAQRRRDVDPRRGCCFWGLSPHLLSGASSFQASWPGRLVAQSAWPKGWAQGDGRSSRVHSKLAGGRTWADHRPVCAGRPGAPWSYTPSAQSGAGFGTKQKKTAQTDLKSPLPTEAAAAYEELRAHLIDPTDRPGLGAGRVVLLRRGMLAWACACAHPPASPALLYPPAGLPVPSNFARELVQFIAGLILSSGKDQCYA
jgi:hypothetical protein